MLFQVLLEIFLNINLCFPELILLPHDLLNLSPDLLELTPLLLTPLQHLEPLNQLPHLPAYLLALLPLHLVQLQCLHELALPLCCIIRYLVGLQSQLLDLLLQLSVLKPILRVSSGLRLQVGCRMLDLVVLGFRIGCTLLVLLCLGQEHAIVIPITVQLHLQSYNVLLQLLVVVRVHQIHIQDALSMSRHLNLRDPQCLLVCELLLELGYLNLEESDLLPLNVVVQPEPVNLVDQILLVLLSESLIDLRELLGLREVVLHVVAILRPPSPLRHLRDVKGLVEVIRQLRLDFTLILLILEFLVDGFEVDVRLHCFIWSWFQCDFALICFWPFLKSNAL